MDSVLEAERWDKCTQAHLVPLKKLICPDDAVPQLYCYFFLGKGISLKLQNHLHSRYILHQPRFKKPIGMMTALLSTEGLFDNSEWGGTMLASAQGHAHQFNVLDCLTFIASLEDLWGNIKKNSGHLSSPAVPSVVLGELPSPSTKRLDSKVISHAISMNICTT